MNLTSDQVVLWHHGFMKLNETVVTTWVMMFLMVLGAKLITRKLVTEGAISRWQGALEIIVTVIEKQMKDVGLDEAAKYLPFLGTLFVFVATCSLCIVIPGFQPPTGSLSTTAALALCVFVAVPLFGVGEQGLAGYLKTYTEPTLIMLPFNIISELSRTLALAVRLFGNIMSGVMIVGILLTITPFIFPIFMTALGLLTGMVQAYIFTILAGVYIAAATHSAKPKADLRVRTKQLNPALSKWKGLFDG
jgi:F-type H+-transporting ATPase subunit a